MPRADVKKQFPKMFTEIAGIRLKQAPRIEYRDDKVDTFFAEFDSNEFETMKEALQEKYPELFCEHQYCMLEDASGSVGLMRYWTGLSTSGLLLVSHKWKKESEEKGKQRRKDI